MACLRDWFATPFDHCKYEFRLLFAPWTWVIINFLRELDANSHHLGGIRGSTERGRWFVFSSEKPESRGSWWKAHVTLTFCLIWREGREVIKGVNLFPTTCKIIFLYDLLGDPQGRCLIHRRRPISVWIHSLFFFKYCIKTRFPSSSGVRRQRDICVSALLCESSRWRMRTWQWWHRHNTLNLPWKCAVANPQRDIKVFCIEAEVEGERERQRQRGGWK